MPTFKWLDIIHDHSALMKKLLPYFQKYDEKSLYKYLQSHGLSTLSNDTKNDMKLLIKQNVWKCLEEEFNALRKEFNGPDVPILILPCRKSRSFFQNATYYRGGIAYKNCICLFLSPLEGILQHKAVLLHEYHHIVRLTKLYKNRKVSLLDAMILEGLAESAVLEKYGEDVQAPWTNLYSSEQCMYYYNKFLKNSLDLTNNDEHFSIYLYGGSGIPKLMGYSVGYDIVKSCIEQTDWTKDKLIRTSSKHIKDNALNYLSI